MGLRIIAILFLFVPALAAQANSATGQTEAEPRYDTGTTVDMTVMVSENRQVAKGNPLSGAHLIVRPETAKSETETIDIYLGPAEFLKDFEVTFAKGDRLQIVGSKVKFGGAPVVLAREVRRSSTTLYLRDSKGQPYWRKT